MAESPTSSPLRNDTGEQGCVEKCSEDSLSTTQVLYITLATNAVFTASQSVAAFISNSVSLKGDSADMAVDTVCYALNVWVERAKEDPDATPSERRRVAWIEGIVVAISAFALLVFTCFLFVEAGERLADPADEMPVEPVVVFVFASMNLGVDIVQAFLMARVFMRKDERSEASNVNMLSAAAHVFADSMRTVSELVSSALAVWFGLDAVVTDAWASFLVNTSVLVAALALLYSLVRRFKSCEDGFEVIDDEGRAREHADEEYGQPDPAISPNAKELLPPTSSLETPPAAATGLAPGSSVSSHI